MNAQEAIAYIHSHHWQDREPGLGRISELLELLGNPQKDLRFIHVAGTNGKGSVCAMLDSILRAAGYRVGLFTSPYIRRFEERMQIGGLPIGEDELAKITSDVRTFAEGMEVPPTEFELLTAIGMEYFRRNRVDLVVLEVGLGGRMDSTNIIASPLLSIITEIDFDHMALLGNTIGKIAAEKAGIIKAGCPALYGGDKPEAFGVIRAEAEKKNAPLTVVDRSDLAIREMTLDGTRFDAFGMKDLRLPLLGTYQPINAATVLTALKILRAGGLRIPEDAVRSGLLSVRWPARFELLSSDPVILIDGGHNPQGIGAAVRSIQTYFPGQKVNLLSGVMADKDYREMAELLLPVAAHADTVTPSSPRSLPAPDYAKLLSSVGIPTDAHGDLTDGVAAAILRSRREGRPLICLGSLYLYGDVTDAVERILQKA